MGHLATGARFEDDPPVILICAECGCHSDEQATGWRAFLADLDDDGEDEVVLFCQRCATYEFGRSDH